MTPEEKHRNKRHRSYAVIMLGVLIFIAGTSFLHHVLIVVLGLLVILLGCWYKSFVDRKYREEIADITETPEINFNEMKHRHTDDEE